MSFRIPAMGRSQNQGPTLTDTQETRTDAARRLGLSDEDFEAAKLLGFPAGREALYFDEASNSPRMARVVLKRETDEWRDTIKRIARALK